MQKDTTKKHTDYQDVLDTYEEELARGCRTEPWDPPKPIRKYKKGEQLELFEDQS